MLMPKRVKRRKQFRGSMKGKALRGNKITYGDFGIVATEPAWIKSNQIEAARIAMTRYIKRGGKVWIKIFPDKPVTKTPAETRMGKGKGALEYWVAVVKPVKSKEFMNNLNGKSLAELNDELVAAKKELFNLRFQNATNQLDNTSRIKEVRKNIARIQTAMSMEQKAAN